MNDGLVSAFQNLGVYRIDKLMPFLDPCRDSISISVRGDTVYVPDFSDILVMRYGSDYPVPLLCYSLITMFPNAVKYAEPNFFFKEMSPGIDSLRKSTISIPNDTAGFKGAYPYQQKQLLPYIDQFGTRIGGIDAVSAWDFVKGDSTIRISVIDDGIEDSLRDFGGPGKVVVDGLRYVGTTQSNANQWNIRVGHGNYVASIIGSLTNDTTGIAGVAGGWNRLNYCRLIAQKVHETKLGIPATVETIAPAIIGAASNFGVPDPYLPQYQKVAFSCEMMNISLRADPNITHSEVVRAALAYAYANDVVPVVAIGNGGENHNTSGIYYPADADDRFVVCVSGSNQTGNLNPNSDYGDAVDFAAPYVVFAYAASISPPQLPAYNAVPGTSGATPLVTGGLALLRAYQKLRFKEAMAGNPQFLPLNVPQYLAPEDYQNIFALSAYNFYNPSSPPLPYTPYRCPEIGYGVINLSTAFNLILPPFSLEHIELSGELTTNQLPIDTMYIAMPRYYTHPGPGIGNLQNDDLYEVIPYRIHGTLSYPRSYPGTIRAWARGAKSIGLEFPQFWAVFGQTKSRYFPLYLNANWANVLKWTDQNVEVETYIYRQRKLGTQGPFEYIPGYGPTDVKFAVSLIHGAPVGIRPVLEIDFSLSELYPSPTKGSALLSLTLNETATVLVNIHDVFGRCLRTIKQAETMLPGMHQLIVTTDGLSTGVYFVRAGVDGVTTTRKLVVFR